MLRTRSIILAVSVSVLVAGVGPGAEELGGLTINDATFTDGVVDRAPRTRLMAFHLGGKGSQARLWFWFKVDCADACLQELTVKQRIPVKLHWYYDTGGMLSSKRVIPLTIEGPGWRTWGYKENLKPGTWKVVVHAETGRVCLKDQPCEFSVEVNP